MKFVGMHFLMCKEKVIAYHFADGASLLSTFLTTGRTELGIHEANLTRDGLSQHRQSRGVVTLRRREEKNQTTLPTSTNNATTGTEMI